MSRLVLRDPFAREELHSARVYNAVGGCAWCSRMLRTPSGRLYLYQYTIESDGGRKSEDTQTFCCVDCRRQYNS